MYVYVSEISVKKKKAGNGNMKQRRVEILKGWSRRFYWEDDLWGKAWRRCRYYENVESVCGYEEIEDEKRWMMEDGLGGDKGVDEGT